MAITARGYAEGTVTGSASSFTPAIFSGTGHISGVSSGDVAILFIVLRSGTALSAPTGWTLVPLCTTNVANIYQSAAFYRICTGTDTNPSVTISLAASTGLYWSCGIYTGVDGTTPIDDSNKDSSSSNTRTPIVPSISPTGTTDMLVMWVGSNISSVTYSAPTLGTIEEQGFSSTTNNVSGVLFDSLLSASGATGTHTVTASATETYIGFSIALLAAATVVTDFKSEWGFWSQIIPPKPMATAGTVGQFLYNYSYAQTPPPPAVGSTGVQFLKQFDDFGVRRLNALYQNIQYPQTPPPPPPTADDPQYWAFWNLLGSRVDNARLAAMRLTALQLVQSEYPQTPPPKPDDPQYWSYWVDRARLTTEEARTARTRAVSALQYQYPQTPPPKPDNPQYWSYWTTRRTADNLAARASLLSLYHYPQTPPVPDNPQYWAFWQLRRGAQALPLASAIHLFQYPQTPPPPAPDNPQYWEYWTQRLKWSVQDIAAANLAALLNYPQTPPPVPPDVPQYWSYWTQPTKSTGLPLSALLALIQYPQTPPPPPTAVDVPQYWAYWTDPLAAIIRQRYQASQLAAQAALALAQYPQTPPPPTPDNPQYWPFWAIQAARIASDLREARTRGVIAELLSWRPGELVPPPPPPDHPQYWSYWTDIAAMLSRRTSAGVQVNITLAQLLSEYAQSPTPAPVVGEEAIVVWRSRGGY